MTKSYDAVVYFEKKLKEDKDLKAIVSSRNFRVSELQNKIVRVIAESENPDLDSQEINYTPIAVVITVSIMVAYSEKTQKDLSEITDKVIKNISGWLHDYNELAIYQGIEFAYDGENTSTVIGKADIKYKLSI